MRKILTPIVGATLLLLSASAQALTQSTVSIAWSPSTSANVASYMIYYGTSSGNYISAVLAPATATNVTIYGLTDGATYYFSATAIDNSGNQSAFSPEISAVVGAAGSVTITSQPSSQSVAQGQNATFAVAASGNSLAYQWNFNGNAIPNATTSTFTVTNAVAGQAGNYSVNVSSSEGGSTNSLPATLTVYATAAASLAAPATASPGQFAVAVSGVPGYQYVVQASTDLTNWISLQTNVAPFNFVDANSGQFPRRFYRTFYLSNSSP